LITNEHISLVICELQAELKHQNDFIEKLKHFNKKLEASEGKALYSVQQIVSIFEQNTSAIRKAMSQLPMEEDLED